MSQLVYLIILGILGLALGSVYLTLLIRFYRRMLLTANCLGKTLQVRLINLAITCLLFPSFFRVIFELPFYYLYTIINTFQKQVDLVHASHEPVIPFSQLSDTLSQLFYEFYNLVSGYFAVPKESHIPEGLYILFGLAFSVALNLIIDAAFYNKKENRYYSLEELNSNGRFMAISGSLKKNIAIGLLLAASLYLALCAIISIPYEGVNLAPVDGRSKGDSSVPAISAKSLLNDKITDTWNADSATLYTDISTQPDTGLSQQSKAILKANENLAKSVFDYWYNTLSYYVQQFNQQVESYNNDEKDMADMLNKKLSDSKLPQKLKYQYYEVLTAWFETNIHSVTFKLDNAKRVGLDFAKIVSDWNKIVHKGFPSFLSELNRTDTKISSDRSYLNDYFQLSNRQPYVPVANMDNSADYSEIPAEPRLGTDWGPLGDSASWLIIAQSLDLVLIVGMFGFGLLGAAISTFVNTGVDLTGNKALITGLTVVIIRGFSAAIIIFLATKGGIAIFNNGTNEPNPYVLFFTCLIGAVYSERIWAWAKTQLTSKLDQQNQQQEQKGNK